MTTVISKDAVINGVLIDLKTPSEGMIKELSVKTGHSTTSEQMLMVLKNEKVSKLEVQEIQSRLNEYKTELRREQGQLERNLSLLQRNTALLDDLTTEQNNYRRLQSQGSQESIAQVQAQLQAAQARLEFAQVNYDRINYLTQEGALAEADLEKAKLQKEETIAHISQLKARLNELNSKEKATQTDLSLNWSPSNFDPNIRLKDLELEIADQRLAIAALQQSIQDAHLELKEAQRDYTKEESTTVKSPVEGIMWNLDAQKGQYVEEGDSLGKVLDCKRRWIDVYLDEKALRSIQPNTPATIELYGDRTDTLQGRVSLVRSGIGRLAPGEEVAVPLIPNLPRQSQLRVELEPNQRNNDPQLFCYVGYTAKVTFNLD
ncbi:MAG: HlyD family efflux transporter periplasmic adaptor subunit [Crocosphaera sp.]|nr:HlyD family efflux transporter periplasmic adaptor subunit [Crocosphaera sp.]